MCLPMGDTSSLPHCRRLPTTQQVHVIDGLTAFFTISCRFHVQGKKHSSKLNACMLAPPILGASAVDTCFTQTTATPCRHLPAPSWNTHSWASGRPGQLLCSSEWTSRAYPLCSPRKPLGSCILAPPYLSRYVPPASVLHGIARHILKRQPGGILCTL
jgi:hypothetical protein